MTRLALLLCCLLTGALAAPAAARASEARVAVAANFVAIAETLKQAFERAGPHRVTLIQGATGKHYAQIVRGAPFDIFLAADVARPERLEREGRVAPEGRLTYAVGRLALWSANPERHDGAGPEILRAGRFRALALANPDLAPYGAAAREVIAALDLADAVADRLAFGENVGQAFALADAGAADLAFVALAQARSADRAAGILWEVPTDLHAPIRQDAALLLRGADNPAARAFFAYLQSPEARALIAAAGYDLPVQAHASGAVE